ncbi:MAG TPA: thiamine phosphate synthase [Usitatibacter sp.]|nr:thiamine phosphate synthase [Usitatibacter sp.]
MASERAAQLRGLYAITPELDDTNLLAERVAQCLAGGAALVQYRAKRADDGLAREQAARLAALCRASGAIFIVNDSVQLARECGADGVHVGREDAAVAVARRALPHAIIGVSCYDDAARAEAAARDGADYVAVGSMFASRTKPDARPAPFAAIARARAASGLPVAAIGGIELAHAASVVEAGADMLAVISALFDARDIEATARDFAHLYRTPNRNNDARTQPRPL